MCGFGPFEGFGVLVCRVDVVEDGALNSLVERWTPRLICLSVSSPNQRSTWFSQEALVCQRGRLANQYRLGLGVP